MRTALLGLALALALALTLASAGVQRRGPEVGAFGNVCGPSANEPCTYPLLNGGWPLAFIHDDPSVSVVDKLGAEDDVRPLPLVLDAAFYWALLAASWGYGRLRRAHQKKLRDDVGPGRPRSSYRRHRETRR